MAQDPKKVEDRGMKKNGYPSAGLHGRVVHDIGARIVGGQIPPGDTLPSEGELAETYGASRSAIREAVKVLAAKGLVEPRRRSGTRVRPREAWNLLDPDILGWHSPEALVPTFRRDLVELRWAIEPAAAELAARRSQPEDRALIQEALDEMEKAGEDPNAFYSADVRFHLAVFAASRNALIERLSTILGPLLTMSFQAQARRNRAFPLAVGDHRAVYESIAAGDARAARKAMQFIMNQSARELEAASPETAIAADVSA
jgi:DNA-binding FadR family transcriptional regulator